MHSHIFQIDYKPVSPDNYLEPSDFYEEASRFDADYIGDSLNNEQRQEYIEDLAHGLDDIFELDGDTLVYKDKDAVKKFIHNWHTYIKGIANNIASSDEKINDLEMWKMRRALEGTHLDRYSRFYIEDWNGCAGTFADFIEYVYTKLIPGDRLYFGAIIDFHF